MVSERRRRGGTGAVGKRNYVRPSATVTVIWAVSLVSEGFDNWPRMPLNNHLLPPLLAHNDSPTLS